MYLRYLSILVLILGLLVAFQFASALIVGSNFTVCTGSVGQASCYDTSPTPTLNWTYSGAGTQASYYIQVDDNSNFSSPLVSTGWVSSSSARSYVIPSGILSFNSTYYWRIIFIDSFGSQSVWINADTSFTTVGPCCSCSADYYRVNKNTTSGCIGAKGICGSNCKKIINNSVGHIFIPAKTQAEWNNFISHPPSGVSVLSCSI